MKRFYVGVDDVQYGRLQKFAEANGWTVREAGSELLRRILQDNIAPDDILAKTTPAKEKTPLGVGGPLALRNGRVIATGKPTDEYRKDKP